MPESTINISMEVRFSYLNILMKCFFKKEPSLSCPQNWSAAVLIEHCQDVTCLKGSIAEKLVNDYAPRPRD